MSNSAVTSPLRKPKRQRLVANGNSPDQRAVPSLNAYHTLPLIFSLPEDVLLTIFLINSHALADVDLDAETLQVSALPGEKDDQSWQGLIDTTSFSQVCHNWREIVLRSPRMWAGVSSSLELPPRLITIKLSAVDYNSDTLKLFLFRRMFNQNPIEKLVSPPTAFEQRKNFMLGKGLEAVSIEWEGITHKEYEEED